MCNLRPTALDRDKTFSPKTPVKMHMPHGRGAKTSSVKIIEQIGGLLRLIFFLSFFLLLKAQREEIKRIRTKDFN